MKESFLLAVSQLRGDRFRTLLSLLGVTVGIFSIVAVFTLVDSLHGAIDSSFEKYGTDILFVEQTPLEPDLNEDGEFRWWEYASRPAVSYEEYRFLAENAPQADIAFKCKTSDGVIGVSQGWDLIVQDEIELGRGITPAEAGGSFVVMLGSAVRDEIFENGENPLGRKVKLYGHDFVVVGVFAPSGSNLVSTVDTDNSYIVPYKALESLVDVENCSTNITVRGLDEASLRVLMRQARRITPSRDDNFAVNRFSFVLSEITDIFGLVDTLGWLVGIFSLLVGGFGIANIMFVSVQERKPEIGIQKALGARSSVIVFQYLSEAVFLSLIGGTAGILLVLLGSAFIPEGLIAVRLSVENVGLGLFISLALGIVSGVAPARHAASLHPADAINSL